VNTVRYKPVLIAALFFAVAGHCDAHDGMNFLSTKRLAMAGDAEAQLDLGLAYWEGHHVPKSEENALDWIIKSAGNGFRKAQFWLGAHFYERGSLQVSASWYRKAADAGDVLAQTNLGSMYLNGKGVSKNWDMAFHYFSKAGNQGFAPSQYYLGYLYANGFGVVKDDIAAFNWFLKAAEQGFGFAQISVGKSFCSGKGVSRDMETGYMWLLVAKSQGVPANHRELTDLEKALTPKQLASAQVRAQNWQAKKGRAVGSQLN